jgi:hypothetical protein
MPLAPVVGRNRRQPYCADAIGADGTAQYAVAIAPYGVEPPNPRGEPRLPSGLSRGSNHGLEHAAVLRQAEDEDFCFSFAIRYSLSLPTRLPPRGKPPRGCDGYAGAVRGNPGLVAQPRRPARVSLRALRLPAPHGARVAFRHPRCGDLRPGPIFGFPLRPVSRNEAITP